MTTTTEAEKRMEALKREAEKVRQNARRQAEKLGHTLKPFPPFAAAIDAALSRADRSLYVSETVCSQCGAGCKIIKVDEWQTAGATVEQTCDLLKRQRETIASATITTHPDEGFLTWSRYNAAEQPGAPAVELDVGSLMVQALEGQTIAPGENLVSPETDPQLFEIDANPPQSGPIVIVSEITQAGAEAVMEEGGSCETVRAFGPASGPNSADEVEITFPPGTVIEVLEGRGCLGRGEDHEGDTGHLEGFAAVTLYVLPSGRSLSYGHRDDRRFWLHSQHMTTILRGAHEERVADFVRAEAALGRVFVETTEKLKPRLSIVEDPRVNMPLRPRNRLSIMPGLLLALGVVPTRRDDTLDAVQRYPGRPAVTPLRPPEVQPDTAGRTVVDRVVQQSALLSADDWRHTKDPGQQVRTTLSRDAAAERKRRNKAQRAARKKNR